MQIGVDAVETLYDKEMRRRTKGKSDSGTESDATQSALKNYLQCRRGDNTRQLKSFHTDTRAEVERQRNAAKKLARARFDNLIYGVVWDETGADSINYPLTLRAVALAEDYAGDLIYSYSLPVEPNPFSAAEDVARDEKTIRAMLAKMEARAFENPEDAANYKNNLTAFKKVLDAFLQENDDRVPSEKAIVTDFVVKLLKLGAS